MANQFFRFKQFTVYHHLCAMKVGTDGVLLGAWAETRDANRVLDIGTGSGLIALMLAQRSEAVVDAIDISEEACVQAHYNINASRFAERISVFCQDVLSFRPREKYDLICCNPPFFSRSLKSPDKNRNLARHDDSLSFESLTDVSSSLLNKQGRLAVIIPSEGYDSFHDAALRKGFVLTKCTMVKPNPASCPKRVLLEYSLTDAAVGAPARPELVIELERHVYSDEYTELTKDFYLNM